MRKNKTFLSTILIAIILFVQLPLQINAEQEQSTQVYLGGNTVGIALYLKGLYVSDTSQVKNEDGKYIVPASKGNIRKGDYLLTANGVELNDISNLDAIVNASNGEKIKFKVHRNGKEFDTEIQPIKSADDNTYRLGLWLRDSIAGIGTITFIMKDSGYFTAVGHSISENGQTPLSIREGRIIECAVTGIKKAENGVAGELKGTFGINAKQIGIIECNTAFGICGSKCGIKGNKLVYIADKSEVHTGKIKIYSDFECGEVKEYDGEIMFIYQSEKPSEKSMIIKVTDGALIEKTGGIVQGMSGSPIMQDGKLVGAVTHVMLSDSSKGYGVFAEYMLPQ